MTRALDRRQFPRVAALENLIRLEWWEPKNRWSCMGQILNISRSGALISAKSVLPKQGSLWLRLDRPVTTPWIDGKVVRLNRDGAVGIKFLGTADELYEAATQGIRFGNLLEGIKDDGECPDPMPPGGSGGQGIGGIRDSGQ